MKLLQAFTLALLGSALPVMAMSEPAAAAEPDAPSAGKTLPWKTVAASGQVDARLQEAATTEWTPVTRGDRLVPRTAVRTGKKGRATLTRRADVLMVSSDTQLELPASSLTRESEVFQETGRVIYEIDGTKHRDFQVVTPMLVAGVKGTVFMVTVTDGFAAVTVEEGVVEVLDKLTGERLDVRAGESVVVDPTEDGSLELVRYDGPAVPQSKIPEDRRKAYRLARNEARKMDTARDLGTFEVQAAAMHEESTEGTTTRGTEEDAPGIAVAMSRANGNAYGLGNGNAYGRLGDSGNGHAGDLGEDFNRQDGEIGDRDRGNGHGNANGHDRDRDGNNGNANGHDRDGDTTSNREDEDTSDDDDADGDDDPTRNEDEANSDDSDLHTDSTTDTLDSLDLGFLLLPGGNGLQAISPKSTAPTPLAGRDRTFDELLELPTKAGSVFREMIKEDMAAEQPRKRKGN